MKYELNSIVEHEYDVVNGSSSHLMSETRQPRNRHKLIILGAVIVVLILGLSIGLGVGLKKSDNNGSAQAVEGDNLEQKKTTTQKMTSNTVKTSTPTPLPEFWTCHPPPDTQCPWSKNPVLLVSLDGFRADYMLRNVTPTIQKLMDCGVHTPYMRAVYPTLTFPNHYTIATGLYPESHGIVGNSMFDPVINQSFSLGSTEASNPTWWQGEPLWITAKKQGKRTASYFWVGSDVNITGVFPDIWKKYNGSITFEERVDTVLEWLRLPEGERPDFITLYFSEPDHWGHEYGPYSHQVNEMLENMDKIISRLVNGLRNQKMLHCLNTIILADHGMEETSCDRRVFLDQYMDIHKVLIYEGTTGHINTKYHKKGSVVVKSDAAVPVQSVINQLECKSSHLNVYTKENIPERHHYTNSRRIGDVIMDVEARWLVNDQKSRYCIAGNHGYDNIYKSMHALFLAYGPDFKKNFTTAPFENIELYNMMSELLGIYPAPNNGTLGSLHHILSSPSPLRKEPDPKEYSICSGPRETSKEITDINCTCTNPLAYVPPSENQTYTPPFDKPALEVSMPTCVLPQRQFLTGFSQTQKMPVWISYTLTKQQVGNINNRSKPCVIYDNRLPIKENPVCDSYQNYEKNVSFYHLYDPGYAGSNEEFQEAILSSTIVPVYNGFRDGIWSYMLKALRDFVSNHGDVHVTMGPVFDYDGDGLWSNNQNATEFVDEQGKVPIPTHFYAIFIRCTATGISLSNCSTETLETQTFILPHQPTIHNCLPERDYLKNSMARIRDVELVTGLRFLTTFSRDVSAQLRTHLSTELWESVYTESWEDLPCTAPENQQCPNGHVPLLLISLDGFRAEYLLRNISPTIQKLSQCGVHTPYMRAVYPTITFPNHYTIVTGLYPESHGIISNNMYDEEINQIFTLSSITKSDPRWWKGEPLWITAQKQGKRTATYFWPGSDVNITGKYPDEWKMYDGKVGFPERLSTVIDWLTLPADQRPHFVTLYFDEPDHAGHEKGPESTMVEGQIETVDEIINRLMNGLYQRGLHNCVNIIILADHGFGDLSFGKTVELKPWYHNITNMLMFEGVVGQVFPHLKKQSSKSVTRQNTSFPLDEIVQNLTCKSQAMKVFTKDTLPKRHHYTVSNRIGDLILDMKEEWLVFDDHVNYDTGGSHGWDNTNKHMHALFLAHGPGFKKNYRADPFENIELYNLMSELLGIIPAANNGTTGSLNHILQNPPNLTSQKFQKYHTQCTAASVPKNSLVSECSDCLHENQTLDDVSDIHNTSSAHLVFGVPDLLESSMNTCNLYQKKSVTAFSNLYQSPVWMSSILSQNQLKNQTVNSGSPCIVKDPRVANLTYANCSLYRENITAYPLFNPAFFNLGSQIFLSSETVPMYDGFINGNWRYMWELAADYVKTFDNISVTVGPVYDYNHDGLWEGITNKTRFADEQNKVPMPTHLYMILIKCKTLTTQLPCGGEVDILSFILPNQPKDPNCLKEKDFLIDNAARIRDIELLVGLSFFTSFDTSVAARLRTFLPEELWPSELTQEWIDLPCPSKSQCQTDYQPVLLISLDGFRADYLLRNFTPHIGRLSQCGIHAPYMRSVYPTKTFPNHYTIVTGLYPESHGIIDNNMYDLNIGNRFSLSSPNASDTRWWGGEPIWITAQKQGHKTATYFWPGSDVEIQGMFPNYYEKYSGSVPYSSRIEKALAWMEMPADQRPSFITLYLDEPDLAGHKYGPTDTKDIGAALERVDEAVGQLMDGLYKRKLHNCVNIIIVADHGMDDVSCDRLVRLTSYINSNFISQHSYVWEGPFGRMATKYIYHNNSIIPATHPVEASVLLNNLTCASPHMKAYEKNQLPVRHHYVNNQRIDDIILDMETGWLVTRNYINICKGGNHGYDNLYKSMQALFLAYGPAFKWNQMIEPFENIELYNLLAEMLNITAAPNNGTEGSLDHLLQHPLNRNGRLTNVQYNITNIDDSAFQEMLQQRSCGGGCPQPALEAHVKSRQAVVSMEIQDDSAGNTDMHLPWGPPVLQALYPNNSIQLLYQSTHATAYFPSLHLPLWVSQTIQKSQVSDSYADIKCIIPDSRVDASRNCLVSQDGFTFQSLLLTELKSSSDTMSALLSSCFVQMKEHFASGVWREVKNLVKQWIHIFSYVNIMTGPVFDTNHDGLSDAANEIDRYFKGSTPVPTHLYLVLTRCNKTGESFENCEKFQTASYILPHQFNVTNCQNISNYMTDNEARVRDVELISGLEFFPKMKKSLSVQLRTYLPSGLWKTK